ncbi:hypothetical protein BCR42DRAFT_398319 [Absidia repens]|uniref:Uncharacterized protein n=1 Tax=Absidia repens TaxID=90262 RepID=A0A1X2HY86_9FUNG|nr:hypothetical protein BCR42DRAFT_398319 [Absidia repens]
MDARTGQKATWMRLGFGKQPHSIVPANLKRVAQLLGVISASAYEKIKLEVVEIGSVFKHSCRHPLPKGSCACAVEIIMQAGEIHASKSKIADEIMTQIYIHRLQLFRWSPELFDVNVRTSIKGTAGLVAADIFNFNQLVDWGMQEKLDLDKDLKKK